MIDIEDEWLNKFLFATMTAVDDSNNYIYSVAIRDGLAATSIYADIFVRPVINLKKDSVSDNVINNVPDTKTSIDIYIIIIGVVIMIIGVVAFAILKKKNK